MPSIDISVIPESLFIVAASSRQARTRAERTVVKGIDVKTGPGARTTSELLARTRLDDGILRAWSIRASPPLVSRWERVRPRDWMLFYESGFFGIAARVSEAVESPAIAALLWGQENAEDLRYVVAFDEVWPIHAEVWPHREEVGARFLGFRRSGEDRQALIRARYGSVDNFVRAQIVPHKRTRK